MGITANNLSGGGSGAGGSGVTTSSFTSRVNALYIFTVRISVGTVMTGATSTNGITFTLLDSQTDTSNLFTLYVYTGICTSASSGTATASFSSGGTSYTHRLTVITGNDPVTSIPQYAMTTATSASLSSFADPHNGTFFCMFMTTSVITLQPGYINLGNSSNGGVILQIAYTNGVDTSPSVTATGTLPVMIAFEVPALLSTLIPNGAMLMGVGQ